MEITNFVENEDGSATFQVDLTNEEKESLLRYAIVDIVKKSCEQTIALNPDIQKDSLDMNEEDMQF